MSNYAKLSWRDALQLGSPATWAAAVIPVAVGTTCALVFSKFGRSDFFIMGGGWPLFVLKTFLMLVTAIALQAAVNTFNDYADFKKGTDKAENSVDLVDVPIIHKNLNPKDALKVGIGYLVIAAAFGLSLSVLSSLWLIVWGVIGAVVVALYSFGPKPISYLPISELISGLVMGGIITNATWFALTGSVFIPILVASVPPIMMIGSIMLTNNTSDIARDREAGRRTLPILLGMRNSAYVMVGASVFSYIMMAAFLKLYYPVGLYSLLVLVTVNIPQLKKIATFDYNYQNRPEAMKRASQQALYVNVAFILALILGALLHVS